MSSRYLAEHQDPILVTGSNGFIGLRVVANLLNRGFLNIRCFVRPSGKLDSLEELLQGYPQAQGRIFRGNLLSAADCREAVQDVRVIYHLAAGIDKSFAGAFMNSVLTTRNLLEAAAETSKVLRFVNVSSFAVYSNLQMRRGDILDESCPIEAPSFSRGDAYTYGKIKQDELVSEFASRTGLGCVTVRPGAVYGPGKRSITGRVGIDTFGIYAHMGGKNLLPLTYVDNCADAIVLAGLISGVDGEIFNVVDDDLPRSRDFLRLYKREVRRFISIPVPYRVAYLLSMLWEKYSEWSERQLPPVFNRRRCSAEWKGNRYSNEKLKRVLGWQPLVGFSEGLRRYFEYQREPVS